MRKYTSKEINEILSVLSEFDAICDENSFEMITQEMSDFSDGENDPYLLKDLVGYQVKYKTDGDHKNDGQMVEYTFTFLSPDGVKSKFSTEMCLMVGWNHWADVTIK